MNDPHGAAWDALRDELDRWQRSGTRATFWWRDDDAIEATPQLERLLQCAGTVPLAIAVIPSRAQRGLAERLAREPSVTVLQHGWAHESHVPSGTNEYPESRREDDVAQELTDGRAILDALFGAQALSVFAPPWHGFDAAFLPLLAACGIAGFTRKGPRASSRIAPSVVQANAHVAPITWSTPPGFAGDADALAKIVEHLRGRRLGTYDAAEPTGLLTHHLAQNDESFAFIERFAAAVSAHPGAEWLSARAIFRV